MAFNIVSHYPDIFATDAPRNVRVKVTFNKGINPDSVESYKFSVMNASTYDVVAGVFSYEYDAGVMTTVVFTPSSNLLPNTKYEVFVHGKPNSILAQDNSQLDDTYNFTFTTGVEVLDDADASGVLINLQSVIYDESSNELEFQWSLDVDSVLASGDIWLTDSNGGSRTIPLALPLSSSIDENTVTHTLTSGNAATIEAWADRETDLQVRIAKAVFTGQGRDNVYIDWRDVLYLPSGVVSPSDDPLPEDYPTISGYTSFQVLSTTPQNQEPNLSGVNRIKIKFSGLPVSTCAIYEYITVEDEYVLS